MGESSKCGGVVGVVGVDGVDGSGATTKILGELTATGDVVLVNISIAVRTGGGSTFVPCSSTVMSASSSE